MVVVVVCGGLMIETKFGRNGVEISKSNYFFIDFLIETLVTCGV